MLSEAIDKLEKELKGLEKEYRVDLPREIQRALQMGDLRENSEYHSALDRQQYVKARIGQLQKQLKDLSLIDLSTMPKDRVALGSSVSLVDAESGKTMTYELVIPDMADFAKGLVSVTSPIGKALVGHRVGDEVTIKTPGGTKQYEIVKLATVHDKESS
ncbi:MAG TPA: transcription elongation factor GreA [Candidatus Polarisedimenticolia bacterium]|nr:transcription elongation factor GreA [Candidatus Polarisedimenticolia bacterium]